MDLETIMLSKMSQSEKSKEPYDLTHMWDIKLTLIDTDHSTALTRGKGV